MVSTLSQNTSIVKQKGRQWWRDEINYGKEIEFGHKIIILARVCMLLLNATVVFVRF